MQLSENGVAFLEQLENFRASAYLDEAQVPTIGYGTTHIAGIPVKLGMTCTRVQAGTWLAADVAVFSRRVTDLTYVPVTQHQFDALVSFTYNLGVVSYAISTLRDQINKALPVAEHHFTDWNKVRVRGTLRPSAGLTARRLKEYQLFIS